MNTSEIDYCWRKGIIKDRVQHNSLTKSLSFSWEKAEIFKRLQEQREGTPWWSSGQDSAFTAKGLGSTPWSGN